MTGKITITSADALGKTYQETVGYTTVEVFTNTAAAQVFDQFGRAIAALTTNTYKDTTVTYEASITEILAEA